jgi:hypothetical protein
MKNIHCHADRLHDPTAHGLAYPQPWASPTVEGQRGEGPMSDERRAGPETTRVVGEKG